MFCWKKMNKQLMLRLVNLNHLLDGHLPIRQYMKSTPVIVISSCPGSAKALSRVQESINNMVIIEGFARVDTCYFLSMMDDALRRSD